MTVPVSNSSTNILPPASRHAPGSPAAKPALVESGRRGRLIHTIPQVSQPQAPLRENAEARSRDKENPLESSLAWLGKELKADWAELMPVGLKDADIISWTAPGRAGARLGGTGISDDRCLQLTFEGTSGEGAFGQTWVLTLQRNPAYRPFSTRDLCFATQMLQMFRIVAGAWADLQAEMQWKKALESVVDAADCGIILLDCEGAVVFVSQGARIVLDSWDGLLLAHGRLTAGNFKDASRLQASISFALQALAHPTTEVIAPLISIARGRAPALTVAVLPLHKAPKPQQPAVAVFAIDPLSDLSGAVGVWCEMKGLTQAEARLARQLLSGATLAEAALLGRIQEQTARAYLRQIFSKLGVSRQVDMVRVLLASIIQLRARFISVAG